MQEASLKLVFRGEISPGFDPRQVRSNIGALLKIDAARTELLFDGRTTTLKNKLNRPDAEKFQRMFAATGAVSIIEASDAGAIATTLPAPPSPPPPRPQRPLPTAEAPSAGELNPTAGGTAATAKRNVIVPGSRGYGILAALFLIVGTCILGLGGYKAVQTARFVNRAATANGTITGFAASRGNSRSTTYAPEVRFRAPSGRMIRFRSQLSTNILSYKIGDNVAVRYDPADPHRAEIDAFMPLLGNTIIILLIGAGFTAFGGRMRGIQGRAKTVHSGRNGRAGAKVEQISCPSCGFQQPGAAVCRACGCKIAVMQEQLAKTEQFAARISGKTAALRIAATVVFVAVGIISFAWQLRSMSASNDANRSVPTIWTDDDHRYEFSVPVDWQLRSTKDVVASFPILRSEPPVMYQLLATSKSSPDTVLALGIAGMAHDRTGPVDLDSIIAQIGSSNRIEFSDEVQVNGLTLHRLGYQTAGGYREDAYFEADRHVILVCFALPAGSDRSERIARTRDLIMSSLTGT